MEPAEKDGQRQEDGVDWIAHKMRDQFDEFADKHPKQQAEYSPSCLIRRPIHRAFQKEPNKSSIPNKGWRR